MKQIVHCPEVGDIVFSIRKGLRNISYRVSTREVSISAPPMLAHKVFPLSQERINWIIKAKSEMAQKVGQFIISPNHPLNTIAFQVIFEPKEKRTPAFVSKLQDGVVTIGYYQELDLEDENRQLIIHRIVKHYLKHAAEQYLPERLSQLANRLGYRFQSVKINSARGRWGSCSAATDINLSCYLMLLPAELIDYVLVHELCHTLEMNHGDNFKKLIRGHFPRFGELDKQLKAHGRRTASFKA